MAFMLSTTCGKYYLLLIIKEERKRRKCGIYVINLTLVKYEWAQYYRVRRTEWEQTKKKGCKHREKICLNKKRSKKVKVRRRQK